MTVVFGGSFGIVNPTRWMGFDTEVLDVPSIGARISTCLWMAGQSVGSHTGSTHCGMMDLGGSVDVPTMQGEA